MKIIALSDQHGFLPKVESCDLLLICGDVTPSYEHDCGFQATWLESTFKHWIESIDAKCIAMVFGNHDFIGERFPEEVRKIFSKYPKHFNYGQSEHIECLGLKVFCEASQIRFFDWAFNLDEPDLALKWELIDKNTDIFLLHGPPLGYGDWSPYGNVHAGSPSLTKKIEEIQPKLVVYGHLHSGRGVYNLDNSVLANVTVVDEKYKMIYKPMIFELKDNKIEVISS